MDPNKGIIIGQKGVKYGLQKPAARATTAAASKPSAAVWGDSDDEDVGAQIARQAEKKRQQTKVKDMLSAALAEDPTVFDYDGVYDSIHQAREQPKQQEKTQRQSKYIASLLEKAEERKREQAIMNDRRQIRENQAEAAAEGPSEVFVTEAYKAKLKEDKLWLEQERLRELKEQQSAAEKVGHMGNFYSNLLHGNVAFGTAKHQTQQASDNPGDGAASTAAGSQAAVQKASAAAAEPLDKLERLRREVAQKLQQLPSSSQEQQQDAAAGDGDAGKPEQEQQQQQQGEEDKAMGDAAPVAAAAGAAAAAAGQKRTSQEAALAARERFLARKRQQT